MCSHGSAGHRLQSYTGVCSGVCCFSEIKPLLIETGINRNLPQHPKIDVYFLALLPDLSRSHWVPSGWLTLLSCQPGCLGLEPQPRNKRWHIWSITFHLLSLFFFLFGFLVRDSDVAAISKRSSCRAVCQPVPQRNKRLFFVFRSHSTIPELTPRFNWRVISSVYFHPSAWTEWR